MAGFDNANFNEVLAAVNKKYPGDLRVGNTYEHPERISSRSLAMDIAMGGGIPVGRVTRIYGPWSSGKTLTGFNIIAEAQKQGMSCCYWNVEGSYDPEFVSENMGVDINKLLVMEEKVIENIAAKMEALLGGVQVHVLDSCAGASTEDLLNADPNQWLPGIRARSWTRAMERIMPAFDTENNILILLDQVRVNFKGGGEGPPGGNALDHASSTSFAMKKGSWLWKNAEGWLDPKAKQHSADNNDQTQPDGREIKARVEKSRVCRPLVPCTMRLDFQDMQFDQTFEMVEAAKAFGVVDSRGGGNYYYPAVPKKGQKADRYYGENALREFISGNPFVQKEIRKKAMEHASKY